MTSEMARNGLQKISLQACRKASEVKTAELATVNSMISHHSIARQPCTCRLHMLLCKTALVQDATRGNITASAKEPGGISSLACAKWDCKLSNTTAGILPF